MAPTLRDPLPTTTRNISEPANGQNNERESISVPSKNKTLKERCKNNATKNKMNRNNKDKKLELLALIKSKKKNLFGSLQNDTVSKQEKEAAWLEVLKKAQSLQLVSEERTWTYARDHLFGLWKSRTLAKRCSIGNIKKRRDQCGQLRTVHFDEIDKAILDILEIHGQKEQIDFNPHGDQKEKLEVLPCDRKNGKETTDKKLQILALIKSKKHILFGSPHNIIRQEKEEAWLEILKKAQSLQLASNDRPWTYARDHLFGLWKSRTMAKYIGKSKKDNSGRCRALHFDEIDKAILDIVGKGLNEQSETIEFFQQCELQEKLQNFPYNRTNEKETLVKEELEFDIANGSIKTESLNTETYETEEVLEPQLNPPLKEFMKRKSKNNSIEDVQRQILESELYYNKLKILKLERELGLPPSKFTEEFHYGSIHSECNDFVY